MCTCICTYVDVRLYVGEGKIVYTQMAFICTKCTFSTDELATYIHTYIYTYTYIPINYMYICVYVYSHPDINDIAINGDLPICIGFDWGKRQYVCMYDSI